MNRMMKADSPLMTSSETDSLGSCLLRIKTKEREWLCDMSMNRTNFIKRLKASRQAYLFLLPLFAGLLIFSYYPAFSGIYHSFFDWSTDGTKNFIGIQNFTELFRDPIFINSIPAMFKLMIPRLIIGIVAPLVMAELIYYVQSARLQYVFRVVCLLPMVAPGVVGTLLWRYIYDPSEGLAVTLVRLFGIVDQNVNIDWLGNPDLTIPSIIFMGFPWIGGTSVLIYLSGLMGIASEVKEASVLDGCGTFKRIMKIDLPLIMGQIRYFFIFGIIGGLQDYGVQLILTQGGPGYTTYVPGYYMFKSAFSYGRMGYASAIGTLLFIFIMILTVLSFRLLKNKD